METASYTVWRPKNIVIIIISTLVINAVLFMGLPVLTRIADRERNTRVETQYMITARDTPKPREEQREKRLRQKELKQIPTTIMTNVSQQKIDAPRFAFDTSADGVGGLEVSVAPAEGMNIDVGDLTFSLGDVDTPPRVIREYPANYPFGALNKGLTGRVFVRVRVGVDGKATNIKAKRAEPPEVLEVFGEAAEEAVAKYRFEPARLGGEAVPVWALQPISFGLY
jgi:protein TonB